MGSLGLALCSKTKFVRKVAKRGQTSCSEAAELLNFVFRENQKKLCVKKIRETIVWFQTL